MLSFARLREANSQRYPLFKNSKGVLVHTEDDDWSDEDWLIAICGEVGELGNLLKKVRRGDMLPTSVEIQYELADIQIYLDLFAYTKRVDMDKAFAITIKDDRITTFHELRQFIIKIAPGDSIRLNYLNLFQRVSTMCALAELGSSLINAFISVQLQLDAVAASLDVNLGLATIQKFNSVSDKIGVDVKL